MSEPKYKEKDRKYYEKYPEQRRANWRLRKAVQRGKVVKPDNCQGCLQPTAPAKLQGHHTDYNKPLDVEWLCSGCHGKEPKKKATR